MLGEFGEQENKQADSREDQQNEFGHLPRSPQARSLRNVSRRAGAHCLCRRWWLELRMQTRNADARRNRVEGKRRRSYQCAGFRGRLRDRGAVKKTERELR